MVCGYLDSHGRSGVIYPDYILRPTIIGSALSPGNGEFPGLFFYVSLTTLVSVFLLSATCLGSYKLPNYFPSLFF